jgi:hypothetical protein
MADMTIQVQVKSWYIGGLDDGFGEWSELVRWCTENDGMSATMSAQANGGGIAFQVEGIGLATVYPTINSYVVYNTFQFEVLSPQEYTDKYPPS